MQKSKVMFGRNEIYSYFCTRYKHGAIAQLVEQRTENPCVPGSIPGGTTFFTHTLLHTLMKRVIRANGSFFCLSQSAVLFTPIVH